MPTSRSRSRKNLEAQLGPPDSQQPSIVARSQETAMQTPNPTHNTTGAEIIQKVIEAYTGVSIPTEAGTNRAAPTVEGGSTGQGEVLASEAASNIKAINQSSGPLGQKKPTLAQRTGTFAKQAAKDVIKRKTGYSF